MSNTIGKTAKAVTLIVVVGSLVAAASPVGALSSSTTAQSGQSSAVGSYASAYTSYSRAWVTGPAGPKLDRASNRLATRLSRASAPKVIAAPQSNTPASSGSIHVPAATAADPLPAAAVNNVAAVTLPPVTLPPGLTLPPVLTLPTVTGVEVLAQLLLLLQTMQTSTLATIAAAQVATLAAIEYARAQTVLAYQDLNQPEQEAMVLAQIDDARTKAIAAYADATTKATAGFAQAITAVTTADPAKFNNTPGEVIGILTNLRLYIQQKMAEAQQQLLAAAAQFASL